MEENEHTHGNYIVIGKVIKYVTQQRIN